jgi:DNA-binding MarR family transcriptional regulator
LVTKEDETWRVPIRDSQGKTPGDLCIERWQEAARLRKVMDQRLLPLHLTFTRWLVLECTRILIAETGDAVSQTLVARRLDMDGMTMSYVMRRLQDDSCVDRGPDVSGPAYRIILTEYGKWAAEEGRRLLESSAVELAVA